MWILAFLFLPLTSYANEPPTQESSFNLAKLTRELRNFSSFEKGLSLTFGSQNFGLGFRAEKKVHTDFSLIGQLGLESVNDQEAASVDLNLAYQPLRRAYFFMGANHHFESGVGYQLGTGFKLSPKWTAELMYRELSEEPGSALLRTSFFL